MSNELSHFEHQPPGNVGPVARFLKNVITSKYIPFWTFHVPTVPYIAFLALKARSPFFFGATNPCMADHGFRPMTKHQLLDQIDPTFLPKTIVVERDANLDEVEKTLGEAGLTYPIVAKPNRGERGWRVEKVRDRESLQSYLNNSNCQVILQEYLSQPHELGVFYWRMPGEKKGHISSIVRKELYQVVGDGKSSLGNLVEAQPEKLRFFPAVRENFADRMDDIIPDGEIVVLDIVGHMSHGTVFKAANALVNERVCETFDQISAGIDGFYYGRYDVKVADLARFQTGEAPKVLEINLTASIPSHIFDPEVSIWEAYRVMFYHWNVLYEIARANNRRGVPYIRISQAVNYLKRMAQRRLTQESTS
ncbi:hypothetical protein [Acanthopleuribacter pedis]|uniref:ATP-grasp domain-containing protein n=1 Tax=Acanthopleuribacter pedis TaxID=442870 RepID=A0A8J7U3S6_9BACT|nr:hypothetical protein [Acanthopleuribacter pedis]MBO1320748.1 hypothetical protein [Acanthopleuribacter pedis]